MTIFPILGSDHIILQNKMSEWLKMEWDINQHFLQSSFILPIFFFVSLTLALSTVDGLANVQTFAFVLFFDVS